MLRSLKLLYNAPYNKIYPFFALKRFCIWKFIRIFHINNFIYPVWNDKKINLHYDNLQSGWIMYNYWVDWEEFNLIKDLLNKDDIVFDIGANIGFYTLWMSCFINGSGKIHSFEPDKKSFARLTNNIALNNISSYVVSNKLAVANEVKHVKFTRGRDGENHITQETVGEHSVISCTTIDQYVKDHKIDKIKYVKIDIEGYEYLALQGAVKTLKNNKIAILQLEINSQIKNSGATIKELLDFVQNTGYRLCSYDLGSKKFTLIDYSIKRENYFMVNNLMFNPVV